MMAAAAMAVPVALAVPAAAVAQSCSGTESSVIVAAGDQFDPSISGPYVVYTDTSAGSADVYYFDRISGTIHPVAVGPGDQQLSDVYGNLVVYTSSNGGPADVFLYDITTGSTQQLTSNAADQINPAVSFQIVAYEDYSSGASDISWYDLLLGFGTTGRITAPGDQVSPSVSGTRIVYTDVNAGSSLVVFDTATAASTTIYGGPASSPDIDGLHIAFARSGTGGLDVSVYDTTTGTTTTLALPGDQVNPHISGDFVSFEDWNSGVSHVALCNYSNGQLYYPNPSPANQSLSDISGNRVVYTDNRSGNLDIYAYDFVCSTPPPPPPGNVTCSDANPTVLASYTLTRGSGKPDTTRVPFTAPADEAVVVCVDASNVSSAWVTLNDRAIETPRNFDPSVTHLERASSVTQGGNVLGGSLDGMPGSTLTVRVLANPGGPT
jgi:TolB protein